MKFFDLFAGVGGFRLGMERAGHECVGSCEWDKYARITYNKNFGKFPEYSDARFINPSDIEDFDVLTAGFPCQAFSSAGHKRGFEDTRGTLFFEIARIAREKKPHTLFCENVKGLLSHEQGATFTTMLQTLDEMGYNVSWQILNSKYFGVPQNRERLFIIANLRGSGRREILPFITEDEYDNEQNEENTKCTGTLLASYYKIPTDATYIKEKDGRLRKYTPIEAERLQGFPDNWTEGVSDMQRYKQMGNAVTVNVIEHIAKYL